jgi:hypothetical protein
MENGTVKLRARCTIMIAVDQTIKPDEGFEVDAAEAERLIRLNAAEEISPGSPAEVKAGAARI